MKDPLTGFTGLELAVTQLRRCYLNKPFDILRAVRVDLFCRRSLERQRKTNDRLLPFQSSKDKLFVECEATFQSYL